MEETKISKGRLAVLCLVLAAMLGLWLWVKPGDAQAATEEKTEETAFSVSGATADERRAFLLQYGWEIEMPEMEKKIITFPEKFDEIYTAYNKVQKTQGMDLMPYAGKNVEQYTYRVVNFPDESRTVQAVLLIYEGKVIGGDLHTVELDGFLSGWKGPIEESSSS